VLRPGAGPCPGAAVEAVASAQEDQPQTTCGPPNREGSVVSRFTAGTAGGPHRIPVIYQGESTAGSAVEAGHQQKPQVSWLELSHTPR